MSRLFTCAVVVICCLSAFSEASQTCPRWRLGGASKIDDDAQSKATCPYGTFVAGCFCEDETTCDGVTIKSETECVASHSDWIPKPTKAAVFCSPKDSRKSFDVKQKWLKAGQILRCHNGYTRELCVMNDPWRPSRVGGETSLIQTVNGCKWAGPAWHQPKIILSILCSKRDGCPGDYGY